MNYAPIALFVYNRPWHTQQTIEALLLNDLAPESEIFIFSDGPKDKDQEEKVQNVRRYIRSINGFKQITIIEREINLGLAQSIIMGVTEIVNRFGRIIVVEDDLVTSPYFLRFMNDALACYTYDERVGSIHAYVYPIKKKLTTCFFLKYAGCWGWATWDRAWRLFEQDGNQLLIEFKKQGTEKKFNFDDSYPFMAMLEDQIAGYNNSWAIRWQASLFLANKLTLHPPCSLVNNIGHDASGVHCKQCHDFSVGLCAAPVNITQQEIKENRQVYKLFKHFFKKFRGYQPPFIRIIRRVLPEIVILFLKKKMRVE